MYQFLIGVQKLRAFREVLETYTRSEAPWLSTRGELPAATASDRTIQKNTDLLNSDSDFYHELVKNYKKPSI